jgi:DNA-binding CsgD family transcriptional regulator
MADNSYIFMGQRFTLREMQVISLTVHGLYHRQTAAYLNRTQETVKTHIKNIGRVLKLRGSVSRQLMRMGTDNGFDLCGNFCGSYLFTGHSTDLPWHLTKQSKGQSQQLSLFDT